MPKNQLLKHEPCQKDKKRLKKFKENLPPSKCFELSASRVVKCNLPPSKCFERPDSRFVKCNT